LMNEAKNDPIKKADLIRDMVLSISKIPDRIQREIYIQECSRIMDISEQVLVSTLAQLVQKDVVEVGKKQKQEQGKKSFEVIKNENPVEAEKVDILYRLERKIIEILLLYGNKTEEFEDTFMKTNEEGEIVMVVEKREFKVFQRIYLSLQEDEVQLANPLFREIFNDLTNYYLQNDSFSLEQYLMHLQPEFAQEVTDILMEEERLVMHNWEGQNIFPKSKNDTIAQNVSETILTLRWYLVGRIIEELKGSISADADNTEPMTMIQDYNGLTHAFSKKLGRVMSRFN
jgi:DNA primase